jgi:hypothetical protein
MTLRKTAAMVNPADLHAKVIEALRHARDFESMMDTMAIYVPDLVRTQDQARRRLTHITARLRTHHIVDEQTLGYYEKDKIVSSLLPPTGGAS